MIMMLPQAQSSLRGSELALHYQLCAPSAACDKHYIYPHEHARSRRTRSLRIACRLLGPVCLSQDGLLHAHAHRPVRRDHPACPHIHGSRAAHCRSRLSLVWDHPAHRDMAHASRGLANSGCLMPCDSPSDGSPSLDRAVEAGRRPPQGPCHRLGGL